MEQSKKEETNSTLSRANVIDRFNGDNKFLSNFYASTFFYEGKKYATVEHAYQAAKSHDPIEQEEIRRAVSPSQAKKMGRSVKLVDGWDDIKAKVMLDLLRIKFQNPFLRHLLLQTGDAILIEGNTWHDVYYGVCRCDKCGWQGQNVLGKLLMSIREEIKAENAIDSQLLKETDES